MIVTIDGPAGAGKSSVAKAVAGRLEFRFLDTGAMYRAVALAGLRARVDWSQPDELARLAEGLQIEVDGDRTLLDGQDVTDAVRRSEVTAATRYAADNVRVRDRLVHVQRELAEGANVVTEGRDQGTVAFPDADVKIFLTASPEERARRRLQDLRRQGETASFEDVLAQQQRRDREDAARPVGALRKAPDAVEVSTDGMAFDAVVDCLVELVNGKKRLSQS
ncbi:MAG: (d)CMP kinase [Thermoguttaceae bacterium]|jgi:cytidylate kinase|nr:(d)CMP kinase [Thermoguttaceae bacterium]